MQSNGIAMRGSATASPSIAMPGNSIARLCEATAKRRKAKQGESMHGNGIAMHGTALQQHSKGRT